MSWKSMVKKGGRWLSNSEVFTTKSLECRYEIEKANEEAKYPRDQCRVITPLDSKELIAGVDFVLPLC